MKKQELLNYARSAMKKAYAPYSKYRVGAALLTKNGAEPRKKRDKLRPDSHRGGKVFTGCNIENNSYGLTVCAERVAILKAVSEGKRQFRMMAIVANSSKIAMPCGACLQVMAEFTPDLVLIINDKKGKVIERKLSDLLPEPFGL